MSQPSTLSEALEQGRARDGAITFIEGENDRTALSFADLHSRALDRLGSLQSAGAKKGDRLILFLNDNQRFIETWWGAVLGGIIPVPVSVGLSDEHRHKLLRIAAKLRTPYIYTDQRNLERIESFVESNELQGAFSSHRSRVLLVETLVDLSVGTPADVSPDDTCFIQFSSGSTSEPKGIVLTHRNILANIEGSTAAAGFTNRDVSLSWMPLTHDMGMIGFHLVMFANGISQNLMPTDLFIRRPLLWLQEAARSKATILCSPNFGYKHFLRKFEKGRFGDFDLSSIRLIFNGAEPISPDLCEEFLDTMSPFGLERTAMYPVYGLAEATLAVAFPTPGTRIRALHVDRESVGLGDRIRTVGRGEPSALGLVAVGQPIPHCTVRVAADDGSEQPEDVVGRILIAGENVTKGYFEDPDTTTALIRDGWLDTGDLGFFHDGDLFIAGRAKEIIFVNGQNYYPHDLEMIAVRAADVELGKIAIAGYRPDSAETDEILTFVQYRGEIAEFFPFGRRIAQLINEHTGLEIAHVVPVKRIPKTTSGKIQRHLLVESFRDGEFNEELNVLATLHGDEDVTPLGSDLGKIETELRSICMRALPDRMIELDTNLFELGTSSLVLIQIFGEIDEAWPNLIEITDLFEYPTIRDLASHLRSKLAEPAGM